MTVPNSELIEELRGLRDDLLETSQHGDREPPGTEVFEALLRALAVDVAASEAVEAAGPQGSAIDQWLLDAVSRRLAWGDSEEAVLADAEQVFDRLLIAADRALADPESQMLVMAAMTQVAVTVSRVVAGAAIARAGRDRAARLREEMTHRQLKAVLEKQKTSILRLERELKQDF